LPLRQSIDKLANVSMEIIRELTWIKVDDGS
jgi:hypothetical protein